ncbi:MAG TPA: hypothetical protein VK543_08610 [Puia sp.]|nr:hypothetical protein [Puia sp.]
MRNNLRIGWLFLVIVLGSCTSTKIVSSWKAPDISPQKFEKVLVVGLMGPKDLEIKENIENAMAEQLRLYGINAITSTKQYGPKTFRNMQEAELVKMLSGDSFDGVMVVSLIDKSKEKYYTPGTIFYTPYYGIGRHFWPYYMMMYDRIYTPGYYTTSTNYTLEANLYDTKNDRLDYSAQAKSYDPGSPKSLASAFSKSVVDDMVKQEVITK